MTRKDYIIIAQAIQDARKVLNPQTPIDIVVLHLAKQLSIDNPKFNTKKFTVACGIKE